MRRTRTLAALIAVVFAALIAVASAASAHVTVTAPGATRGGSDQEITFRVPVEKKIDTVGLKVQLPVDTPIVYVDVLAMPGWTHSQKMTTLDRPITTDDGSIDSVVSEIDWTATGGGLKPGEYGEFTIIAGALPDVGSITFKAIQVYSDGSTVNWTQTRAPGSNAELDTPAPVLTLAPKGSEDASTPASAQPQAQVRTKSTSDTGPIVLSVVALVVAAAALGLAVVSRARGGRRGEGAD